jgi:hypothetical protein
MRGGPSPIVASTARTYEVTISLVLEYLLDARYGWAQISAEQFGRTLQQVLHEGNSVLHKLDCEADPRRRNCFLVVGAPDADRNTCVPVLG